MNRTQEVIDKLRQIAVLADECAIIALAAKRTDILNVKYAEFCGIRQNAEWNIDTLRPFSVLENTAQDRQSHP